MNASQRVVLDTNTLISGVLLVDSIPGQAVRKAITEDQVLSRKKFDRYLRVEDRAEFVRVLLRVVDIIPIVTIVRACRADADNRILEVAVNGDAEMIVSGDRDLLVLHSFRDIPILTAGPKPVDAASVKGFGKAPLYFTPTSFGLSVEARD